MNFEEFIEFCNKNGFGIVAFNTYYLDGEMCCYIMAAEKGDMGLYIKGECLADQLSKQLALMAGNIKKRKADV